MKKILLVLIALAAVQYAYSAWRQSGVTAYSSPDWMSDLTPFPDNYYVSGNPRVFTIYYDMNSNYTGSWYHESKAWVWVRFHFVGVNYQDKIFDYSSDDDGGSLIDEFVYDVPGDEIVFSIELQTHAEVDPRHLDLRYCTSNLNVYW